MDYADDDSGYGKHKTPKVAKVKDKTPAPVQITAEQLLREAKERELELSQPSVRQKISDAAELKDYQMRKRKAFEDNIRKNRTVITNWLKYAAWEESQHALRNARSVYERALDVDHRNTTIWLKYAEMEMRNKQTNSARNIWDRAVTILPRVNQFWLKYTQMEEILGNIAGCRQVFERWMEWKPEEQSWHSYIKFELKFQELDRARMIYERFVIVHPEVRNWIKYANFEAKHGFIGSSRSKFERAVDFFGDEHLDENLLIAFARFEENQKEHERAKVIYKFALDRLPKERCEEIYRLYANHEKRFGTQGSIEDVLTHKRKFHFEEQLKLNPYNYDVWFDYIKLMEGDGDSEVIRDLYQRAIAKVPPSREKNHWRRYIYLWIFYATYEELDTKDYDKAREVFETCRKVLEPQPFTFAKIWYMNALFEIRRKNLKKARLIMGNAIGRHKKAKLYKEYINIELKLREFNRCRTLYEKFLKSSPENCRTWIQYAEMETSLNDIDRARGIYEIAVSQPFLDMPEVLWKAYIEFETVLGENDNVRDLYKRILEKTNNVKVWLSLAMFELQTGEEDCLEKSRDVYKRANTRMKRKDIMKDDAVKEERVALLEKWREFEEEYGDDDSLEAVKKLMPRRIMRTRRIEAEGNEQHWEEYCDYIFPDDEGTKANMRLLQAAQKYIKEHNPGEE